MTTFERRFNDQERAELKARVIELREAGLSCRRVAELTHVSKSYVARIDAENIGRPRESSRQRAAGELMAEELMVAARNTPGELMLELVLAGALTDAEREVLIDHAIIERPLADIAVTMGCSRNHTWELHKRAVAKLRRSMTEAATVRYAAAAA